MFDIFDGSYSAVESLHKATHKNNGQIFTHDRFCSKSSTVEINALLTSILDFTISMNQGQEQVFMLIFHQRS